jgi:hypothetical protein
MRTFIGLPFTCCLIGLSPIRCLFPCSDTSNFYFLYNIQNPYIIYAPLIFIQSVLPCAPLFVIIIVIIIAIAIVIIAIVIVVIASFIAKIVAYRSLLLLLLFV